MVTAEDLVNEIIVAAAGGHRRLARAIGKTPQSIIQWCKRGSIPQVIRGRLIEEIRKRGGAPSEPALTYLRSMQRGRPR